MARTSSGKEDAARTLYSQGLSVTAIAKRLDLSRSAIQRYKTADRGTDRDWDKHRADLKGKTPPPKPNLVTFERPRGGKAKAATPERSLHDLDHADLAHEIVTSTASLIRSGDIPPALGSALNGLLAWVKFEQEMRPATAAQLAEQAMALGIRPNEFMQQLREAWERAG